LPEVSTIEESAEPGEQCSVGRPKCRACHLAPEHCHLVTEHDDFDGQFFAFVQAESEQLEQANEGHI
jgi:hypothetical protein